jgi:hypothetical protein
VITNPEMMKKISTPIKPPGIKFGKRCPHMTRRTAQARSPWISLRFWEISCI